MNGSFFYTSVNDSDIEEIRQLLNDVWPKLYGETGCPEFSHEYLSWLYKGPDADRHFLRGFRNDAGELVGFKASLYRSLAIAGQKFDGYLVTHLASQPNLSLGEKMAVAAGLSPIHTLETDPDSLSLAFFEPDKTLVPNRRRAAEKAGYKVEELRFQQHVVNKRRLMSADLDLSGITVCESDQNDADAWAELIAEQHSDNSLMWMPSKAALSHHLGAAPASFQRVAKRGETPIGVVGGYVLDWMKAGVPTRFFICEMLAASEPEALNALLRSVIPYADSTGATGVIVENATHLSQSFKAAGGIIRSPREMILAIRSNRALPSTPESFTCDIK
ncbi:hypothetical protein ALP8811_03045 [Aliiroseovarius pelagivivens]|uniref:Phosphatidylglycerol lysyltransferase C-terminal domain-containing protein n=1 Tax=Aliiroseovarius pelagivivens TaxID=1639690 RepID=A0A2R8AT08_9RHOB|nr:hypothetical protein [Aliiroseovarius pelagivivens]SPF79110.1 hypothetical protein ALP8811_03045 [Aliiroseovarius pelagivivens]